MQILAAEIISITKLLAYCTLHVDAAHIQWTNVTCESLQCNNLSVNRQGLDKPINTIHFITEILLITTVWELSPGIIASIVSIVVLVITSCGYLLICVFTATTCKYSQV